VIADDLSGSRSSVDPGGRRELSGGPSSSVAYALQEATQLVAVDPRGLQDVPESPGLDRTIPVDRHWDRVWDLGMSQHVVTAANALTYQPCCSSALISRLPEISGS
jgi:hypothetical protein